MNPYVRLCLAAFGMDMALYLTMTGVPYKALHLGAGPLLLGFLPLAYSLPYTAVVAWAGRHIDRGDRLRVARRSLFLGSAAIAGLAAAGRMPWVFAGPALLGGALAFFWPAMQATFADVARRDPDSAGVARSLGWFNISWSSGKGLGYLGGGFILAAFGFTALFLAAACLVLVVVLLIRSLPRPRDGTGTAHGDSGGAQESSADPVRLARFRAAAWLANGMAFGAAAILNHQYPKWLASIDLDERVFGAFLGLVFLSQTVGFVLLRRWRGWHYRAIPLVAAQVPMLVVMTVLPRLHAPALILATAPLVGLGIGMSYFSSLFYSVASASGRGRFAGIHEAALGVGSVVLPLLGGIAARLGGRLEWTYWLGALFMGAGIALQAFLLRGARRPPILGTAGSGTRY